MPIELTNKQEKVLTFICAFIAENGYSPTTREIAERFKFGQNGAIGHLSALEKKGRISRVARKSRTIQIL